MAKSSPWTRRVYRYSLLKQFFRDITWRALRVIGAGFVVARVNGKPMVLPLGTPGIAQTLFRRGGRELDHSNMLLQLLKPGDRCLDLGANIGYYTIMMASAVGKDGAVLAVEPDPRNLPILRANIALNNLGDNVAVLTCAISDTSASKTLSIDGPTNLSRLSSEVGTSSVSVETRPLVDLSSAINPVDLLRMDVEGSEVDILAPSQAEFIRHMSTRAKIFVEIHPDRYQRPAAFEEMVQSLCSEGFSHWAVVSEGARVDPIFAQMGLRSVACFREGSRFRCLFLEVTPSMCAELGTTVPQVVRYFVASREALTPYFT